MSKKEQVVAWIIVGGFAVVALAGAAIMAWGLIEATMRNVTGN